MRCFWDERQRAHSPAGEFFNGAVHPAAEKPSRVDAILRATGPTETPRDFGLDPLLRVHTTDYIEFLRTAHDQWRAAGRDGDAFPYTFPVVQRRPLTFSMNFRNASWSGFFANSARSRERDSSREGLRNGARTRVSSGPAIWWRQ